MAVITVPRPIREKLGDDGADALVALLNQVNDSTRDNVVVLVEEKFERRLSEEFGKFRAEMAAEFAKLRGEIVTGDAQGRNEMTSGISSLRNETIGEFAKVRVEMASEFAKLRVEMAETKMTLIRWMFLFWVGQLIAMTSILFAFFRR